MHSKSNPKAFCWYARQKLKTKDGVAPLLENTDNPDSMKYEDEEKANILQSQFSSVFTREPDGEIPTFAKRTNAIISSLKITELMVHDELLKLNSNKWCGPDNINPKILIELADSFSKPISLLLNKTVEEGEIPVDWKKANVSPIFKKGSKSKAENYRPISLTSIVCKIMETLLKREVMTHLIAENLLSSKQFGFINGRSTVTQLLAYLDKIIEVIVDGGVVDAIYLDFQKAFDTVPHRRLLRKLESYGIQGDILQWINAFLSGRTQVVMLMVSNLPQSLYWAEFHREVY